MSGSNRSRVDLDYAELHRTGRRVPKNRNFKMTNPHPDFEMQAINVTSDIEDLFESYQIENLTDEDELNDFVTKIGNVKRDFRRTHAQLKIAEGVNFEDKYPGYGEQLKELTKKFKIANDKLSCLRKSNKEKLDEIEKMRSNLETEKLRQETVTLKRVTEEKQLQFRSEWNFCISQINWQRDDCNWETFSEIEDVKNTISLFESRLEKNSKICGELEGVYGDEASDLGFIDDSNEMINAIREHINLGKLQLVYLRDEKALLLEAKLEKETIKKNAAEQKQIQQAKFEEKLKIEKLMDCAQNLEFEITMRHDTLKNKCDIDLEKLGDYEILNLKKREDGINSELRELLDKISSLIQFVVPCGNVAATMWKHIIAMRNNISREIELFLKKVQKTTVDRDISEKKLKNSAGLNIQLPKFKGYYSNMNIYTFRSEFKKLIEPEVQNVLWADYLKKFFLAGAALNLVLSIDNIDTIWEKLTEVYGNTQLLLQNKINSLEKFSNLEKMRDDEKITFTISSILNVMADLSKLALEYDLEGELYYGGGLQKILELIGKYRERKFVKITAKENLKNKEKWDKLVEFLKNEVKEREAYILNDKSKKCMVPELKPKREKENYGKNHEFENDKDKSDFNSKIYLSGVSSDNKNDCTCYICGNPSDHVRSFDGDGKPYIEYVACKQFVEMSPRERDKTLFKKRFCNKCLKPGVKWNSEHQCDKKYSCNQNYIKNGKERKCEKHVLVCGYHVTEKGNKDLLDLFKKNMNKLNSKFQNFTKEISISCFAETYNNDNQHLTQEDNSIFAFQTINVDGLSFNLFYDTGCGDLVINKESCDKLKSVGRAKLEFPGPIVLNGVGNQESICEHGVFSIRLPLGDGREARMCGVCVDSITAPFPKYPLKKVEEDIHVKISRINSEMVLNLPKLPNEVGGTVDIMVGKQYLKYFPREIVQLESGLTLYKSRFKSPDDTDGVIAGPHPEFTKINRMAHFISDRKFVYFSPSVQKYKDYCSLTDDVTLLGYKKPLKQKVDSGEKCEFDTPCVLSQEKGMGVEVYAVRGPKMLKRFDNVEESGTNHSYRCHDCRNCLECKNGGTIEEISIQEEHEQNLINKSVTIDLENKVCVAKLPFIANPETRLVPNLATAQKVYSGQVRKLDKSQEDKKAVIEAEEKLQKLGYVEYLDNLNTNDKNVILNSSSQNYIPWRLAWSKSISSPVRPVFDASQRTPGGYSLNDILAKGSNNMNKLIEILIRWSIMPWAFHTDIRKMYNAVQLDKSHWCYQLYLWHKDLDPKEEPKTKVIKTVIYGVRSSGNQAERAVRLTAEKYIDQYPKAYDIIHKDVYVDDCISGALSESDGISATDELKLSLEKGGFTLKGFSFSGREPDESLSTDKESVSVGGLKWYTKDDYIMLNVSELNFSRKIRGRKCESGTGIPEKITMRDCVGKVAEMFDPLGKVTPLIAGMKLDISYLHRSGLSWDDEVPENLRGIWDSNFGMMQEIGQIRYKRAIIPVNARSLEIETIDTGDASSKLICVAIYARFGMKDGTFSCQLVFSRSKVVPEGITIPRAELMAATMNAATGQTVKRAFGDYHKKAIKLTDSMVALHWICSRRTVLKTWVRNRVIEINRLVDASCWRNVESSNMIADLGTRKGAKISDVVEDSDWINGLAWMRKPEDGFPTFTLDELKLSKNDVEESEKEKFVLDLNERMFLARSFYFHKENVDKDIRSRYQFSDYLIDPNRFRFRKVLRILALVFTFIKNMAKNVDRIRNHRIFHHKYPGELAKNLKPEGDKYILTTGNLKNMGSGVCKGGKVIELSNDMLKSAMYYFSYKSSLEVKHFMKNEKYVNISKEIDEVLYYVGRIPPDYVFDGYPELCEAAIDLCRTTFCVPVMDQCSPVAISIAMEIHWYHPDVQHRGIETILRQTQSVAHIIGGRHLAKSIKRGCIKCRILNKKSVDVIMGQIQDVNLCIAPAFFASQVDIFGPYKSYSSANKRATIKVWFLIFCCCTTGGVDIRVLEDYSTDSFVLGFVRFACRFGYPKYVLPDPGSQLVKGCETMNYSFSNTKQKLSFEYGVNYTVCPVGAHYVHGKVERKIKEVKKSVGIQVKNERLSVLQWETLMQKISNSVNNLPIGLKNKTEDLENLDIITPNRLILGRNNERCPNAPLTICPDHKKLLESNANILKAWFKAWLVSYVPLLMERPKWHVNDKQINTGDVVLFLKSEREYDLQYQYGIVSSIKRGKDGHVRKVDVKYQNHNEAIKRVTQRGVRDLVIVHSIDELDIYEELNELNE